MPDPLNGQADRDPADHRQIQGGHRMSNTATIFSRRHIQAKVQAVFNPPVLTVGFEHLFGRHRTRTDQPFVFDFILLGSFPIHKPRQAGRLLRPRKADLFGRDCELLRTARLDSPPIQLNLLNRIRRWQRKKKRVSSPGELVPRSRPRWVDCLSQ